MIKVTFILLLTTLSTIAMNNEPNSGFNDMAPEIAAILAQTCDVKSSGKLLLTNRHYNDLTKLLCTRSPEFAWSSGNYHTCSFKKDPLSLWGKMSNSDNPSPQSINVIKISPDQSFIATGSGDATIDIWDIKTGERVTTLQGHTSQISGIIITSDNKSLISCSNDFTIKIWDLETKKCVRTYNHGVPVDAIYANDDYIFSSSGGRNSSVKIWDRQTHSCVTDPIPMSKFLLTQANIVVAIDSFSRRLSLYDLSYNSLQYEYYLIAHVDFTNHHPLALAISPNEQVIFVGFDNGTIQAFDAQSLKLIKTINTNSYGINDIVVSNNNKFLITCSHDKNLSIISIENGLCLPMIGGHTSEIKSIDISKENNFIVSGSSDGTTKIWSFSPLKRENVVEEEQEPAKSSYWPCTII